MIEQDKPSPLPWIPHVQAAGTDLVARLAKAAGFLDLVQKGPVRIQVDVNWYEPLGEDTIQKMGVLGLYLVRDEPVTCAIRRLTFQAGGEPPCAPKPWSWSGPKEAP